MLDKLTKRIMDSFHRNAKDAIVPSADEQINIGSTILKFGTMILLFFGILRAGKDEQIKKNEYPAPIIINNYITKGEAEVKE